MIIKSDFKKYCFLFILLLVGLKPLLSQTGPGSFLPEIYDIPGWRPAGDPEVFKSGSLEKIAGDETGLILEYGFNYAVLRRYYNFRHRVIKVQVYTMNNTFGSYGLFLRHSGKEKVFNEYGNSCYEKQGEFGFWKQFYFIRMNSDITNDTVSEGYRQIASFIDSKIKSRGLFPGIMNLSGDNARNVRIFRGPLALSEIYYFSPLNIFFVNEGISFEKDDTTKIILRYSDNNEAVRRYTEAAGVLGTMPEFTDFVMDGSFSYTMKDKKGKTLVFRVNENNLEISIKK
ncbi:MAG: DUF6599 family protein [Bacteroidales bacterium]|jgi:hypothetical protein